MAAILANPAAEPVRAAPAPHGRAASGSNGPSLETRRFSAGMRLLVALMCTLLLVGSQARWHAAGFVLLLAYGAWAGHVLYRVADGRARPSQLLCYWIDVAWALSILHVYRDSTALMTLTLVQPVVLGSVGYGVRHGLALASAAALGLMSEQRDLFVGLSQAAPALSVMALVPAAALIARPMSLLRWRMEITHQLENGLDPRRGMEAVCIALVERLRATTQAQMVALVLPAGNGAPAVMSSAEDGGFRLGAEVQRHLEALLLTVPAGCAVTYRRGLRWLGGGARVHGDASAPAGLHEAMERIAELLESPRVVVLPLRRYERHHGHLIVGRRRGPYDTESLTQAGPELVRLIEQAALVDQLQEETAAHERARIGRDLHDSAIQPYLGLKYAVECVALHIPQDNPARAEVDALAELVNAEVASLRELISGLRTGRNHGDNALVPAVRRQARRFSLLFGIDVHVECPESLHTSRALAGAMFHMVNEALNNVRKHTQATRVWITLSAADGAIHLVVRDNAGTVTNRPAPDFKPRSLAERASELGGSVTVERPDGLNTELTITVAL